ncbi:hypothetical protein [Pedobacter africanus]|uniref:Uncharacterized protein n=1 Tax=Pedobacter africanus TaxID=151894 RepID=A0A1W2EA65_9SPHI|nr:hypothetical protein [Pedobacter africanus]SMD06634.1 hypothetical protein SAMN04488524_4623 [Pedobacter africanus]
MMNQEDIFKKVGQILNELQDQYDFLAQNPGQLNELELELFLANANFLSDHVQIVKKINSNRPQRAIAEHIVKEPAEPEITVIHEEPAARMEEPAAAEPAFQDELFKLESEPSKLEFLLNETPVIDKFEFEEQPVEAIFDRPLSAEEEEIIAQKQKLRDTQPEPIAGVIVEEQKTEPVLATAPEQESIPEPEPLPELVPDIVEEKTVQTFTSEPVPDKIEAKVVLPEPEASVVKPTLNDLLAGKNNLAGSLNEESNKAAITDLKQAINLNQKLLFIKDLFNGYNLAYAEAIELLNKMPDFKTADTFLQHNYAVKNNWAAKQGTVDQFYELLNQRFPVG